MEQLVWACIYFLALHFVVAGTSLRRLAIGMVGPTAYQATFFLLALTGFVWMITGYVAAPAQPLWGQWPALDPLFLIFNFVASIMFVAGLTVRNPGTVWMEKTLHGEDVVRGFLRITRHPMNVGLALFSLAHLLQNGDSRSLILFGAIFILASFGPLGIDARRKAAYGEAWESFAARTSYIPFVAIIAGRNTLKWGELGWWRVALGVALFAALYYIHGDLSGVPLVER